MFSLKRKVKIEEPFVCILEKGIDIRGGMELFKQASNVSAHSSAG
jgi:hypothetical protein